MNFPQNLLHLNENFEAFQVLQSPFLDFLKLLAEYNRLVVAPAIFELFRELKMAHESLLDANVYSPFSLTTEQVNQLKVMTLKQLRCLQQDSRPVFWPFLKPVATRTA